MMCFSAQGAFTVINLIGFAEFNINFYGIKCLEYIRNITEIALLYFIFFEDTSRGW